MKKRNKKWPVIVVCIIVGIIVCVFAAMGIRKFVQEKNSALSAKPVIYLYPEQTTEVTVHLDYSGKLTCTYPDYGDGFRVIARPDGSLTDIRDGNEYSYLFWEGVGEISYDMSKGFVVKKEDSADFLREKLSFLGLRPEEYNEFIVYWLPRLLENPYNLITFQQETYTDHAHLSISPEPDSMLRVFMVYKPLDHPIEIEEQTLKPFTREGFCVIEWGGTELH